MAGTGALQGTQSQAIRQLLQQHNGDIDAARDAYMEAHPNADPAEVRALFNNLTASSGSNVAGGSVVGRPVPVSSTPSMGDSYRLSNAEFNRIAQAAIRAELGTEVYDRLQGSILIYTDATVHRGSEITTANIDGVSVSLAIDGLGEGTEQALRQRIESALTNSTEIQSILLDIASKSPQEGADTRVRLTTPIDFSGPANLSQSSIRLPPQGNFVPVVGNLSVRGQSQEGPSYQRTYAGVLIAPANDSRFPPFGESEGGVEVGGVTYYPVPFINNSAYSADAGFVLYAPLTQTSSPNEVLKSLHFTEDGGHIEFYPPASVIMRGSPPPA